MTRVAAFCAVAFLAVYGLGLAVAPSESYLRLQSNLLYNLPGFVALVIVLRRARQEVGRERWGWVFVAALLATWQFGDWLYSYYDLAVGAEPPLGIADGAYVLGYVACFVGLPLLIYPRHSSIAWVFDAVLVSSLVAASFQWEFIMRPIVDSYGELTSSLVLALSYPFLDVGLLAVILGGIFSSAGRLSPRASALLAATVLLAITDSLASYAIETGYDSVGNPLEMGWLFAYVLIGLASTLPRQQPEVTRHYTLPILWLSAPYILAMPLPLMVAIRAFSHSQFDALAVGGALVLLLAFVKQTWTMIEASRAIDIERERARRDALTGLLNHGAVVEEAQRLLASDEPTPFCLALIDLDDLKTINDRFGHAAGDAALRILARCLNRVDGYVGRYGGDEFLILRETSLPDAAEQLGFQLMAALAQAEHIEGADRTVTASFGISTYPDDGPDLVALFQVADAAMYLQKRSKNLKRPPSVAASPAA